MISDKEKQIAIEFGNWLSKNDRCGDEKIDDNTVGFTKLIWDGDDDSDFVDFKSTKELFEEFIKEYYGK